MSSRSLNRKDFLVLTVSSAAITAFLEACGSDDPTPTGTAGTGTAGTGTAGTGTAGTGTAGTGSGGMAGSGGAAGGSGGKGGSGGASGGSGGAAGGSGGGGGGGGGMCNAVGIMQTSNEQHDHIPDDPTMLKNDLKTLINGATPTMNFTVPSDGPNGGHTHVLKLSVQEAMMLKGGGMITGKKTETDATNHTHTYTIGCS